jgi:phenylacetate-coenzyme A ligase PaaK-like adenylate-forming protein
MGDAPLRDLPVLTKALVMEHFDEVCTRSDVRIADVERYLRAASVDELLGGRYYVAATAGTTGRRGVFVWSSAEWVDVVASYNRAFDWAGSTAGLTRRVRTAVVSSTNPSHQSARVGASVHSRWLPTLRLDAGDPLPTLVERLNSWQPEMLIGYASILRLLAVEQLAGRLSVMPGFVFSASEVLTASARSLIERAWGRPPRNVYGATETSGIAAECGEHQGMHVFDDLVVLEVVDDEYRPVPPGQYGATVLVSVLFSRTMPLIRYEMSDSVKLSADGDCACGRPYTLLEGIQGRVQETLRFATPTGGARDVQPVVFHHVMDPVTVAGWQIVQRAAGLEVLLARPGDVDTAGLAASLSSALEAQGVVAPPVTVRAVETIPHTALGKAPLIVRGT